MSSINFGPTGQTRQVTGRLTGTTAFLDQNFSKNLENLQFFMNFRVKYPGFGRFIFTISKILPGQQGQPGQYLPGLY